MQLNTCVCRELLCVVDLHKYVFVHLLFSMVLFTYLQRKIKGDNKQICFICQIFSSKFEKKAKVHIFIGNSYILTMYVNVHSLATVCTYTRVGKACIVHTSNVSIYLERQIDVNRQMAQGLQNHYLVIIPESFEYVYYFLWFLWISKWLKLDV